MWEFSSYWWPDLQMFPVLRDPSQPLAFLIFTNANTPVLFPCMGTIASQNCPFLYEKKSTPEVLLKVWRQGKCSINQNQESNWHFAHLAHTERKHTAGPACTVPSAPQKLSGWAGQMAVSILVSFPLLIKQNTDRKQLMGGKEGLSSDNSRSQSTVAQKLQGQEL